MYLKNKGGLFPVINIIAVSAIVTLINPNIYPIYFG